MLVVVANGAISVAIATDCRPDVSAADETVVDDYDANMATDGYEYVLVLAADAGPRLALLALAPAAAVAAAGAVPARIEVRAVVRPRTRGDWSSRNRTRSQTTFSFVFANRCNAKILCNLNAIQ